VSGADRPIARIWRGRTPAAKAAEYLDFLQRKGLSGYRATEGNRGVEVLFRIDGDVAEFLLVSHWDGYDAIRVSRAPIPSARSTIPKTTNFCSRRSRP